MNTPPGPEILGEPRLKTSIATLPYPAQKMVNGIARHARAAVMSSTPSLSPEQVPTQTVISFTYKQEKGQGASHRNKRKSFLNIYRDSCQDQRDSHRSGEMFTRKVADHHGGGGRRGTRRQRARDEGEWGQGHKRWNNDAQYLPN